MGRTNQVVRYDTRGYPRVYVVDGVDGRGRPRSKALSVGAWMKRNDDPRDPRSLSKSEANRIALVLLAEWHGREQQAPPSEPTRPATSEPPQPATENGEITFKAFADGEIDARLADGIGESSMRNLRIAVRLFTAAHSDEIRLSEVTTDHVRRFIHRLRAGELDDHLDKRGRRAKGRSTRTLRNYVASLQTLFVAAKRQGLREDSPTNDLTKDIAGEDADDDGQLTSNYEPVSREVCMRIIDGLLDGSIKPDSDRLVCADAWAAALLIARFTGARRSELFNVRADRLDVDGRLALGGVRISRPCVWIENAKTYRRARNRRRYRVFPLCRYAEAKARELLRRLPDGCEYLIRDRIRSAASLTRYQWLFKAIGERPPRALWQNCRRAVCVEVSERVPIATHCDLLGHTIQVAQEFYLRPTAEQYDRVASITTEPASVAAHL